MNDGGGRLRAARSSANLRGSLLADLADVDVRARRVVDVVDGDVGEAILGERGELGVIDLAVLVFVELASTARVSSLAPPPRRTRDRTNQRLGEEDVLGGLGGSRSG